MRSSLPILAALLLLTSGCDRFAEEPLQPLPPSGASASVYVKGVAQIAQGASAVYRSQAVVGAESYDWSVFSPDEITPGEVELVRSTNTRIATVTGRSAGSVIVRATARGADGRTIASGTREIVITQ